MSETVVRVSRLTNSGKSSNIKKKEVTFMKIRTNKNYVETIKKCTNYVSIMLAESLTSLTVLLHKDMFALAN